MFSNIKSGLKYTFNYTQFLKEEFSKSFKNKDFSQIKSVIKDIDDHIAKKKKNVSEIISPKELEETLFYTLELNKEDISKEKLFIEQILKLMVNLSDQDKENLKFSNILKKCTVEEISSALTDANASFGLRIIAKSPYGISANLDESELLLLRKYNSKLKVRVRESKLNNVSQLIRHDGLSALGLMKILLHSDIDFLTPGKFRKTPLIIFTEFFDSCSDIFNKLVEKVYEQGGSDAINQRCIDDKTALMYLLQNYNYSEYGNIMPYVVTLIECGADISLNSTTSDGRSYSTLSHGHHIRSNKFEKESDRVLAVLYNRLILDDLIKNIADTPYFMSLGLPTEVNNHIMSFLINYDQIEHDVALKESIRSTSKHLFNSVCASGTILPELVPCAKRMLIDELDKNHGRFKYYEDTYKTILSTYQLPVGITMDMFEKMVVTTFNAKYNAENPEAAKRGYGPGALVVV